MQKKVTLDVIDKLNDSEGSKRLRPDDWHMCRNCARASRPDNRLKLCKGCELAWYCGPECQRDDWKKGHKTECAVRNESTDARLMKAVITWTDKMLPLIQRGAFYGLLPAKNDPKGQRNLLDTHYLMVDVEESPLGSGKVVARAIQVRDQSELVNILSSEMREGFKQRERDAAASTGKPVAGTALIVVRCGEALNKHSATLFESEVNKAAGANRYLGWQSELIRIANLKDTRFYKTPKAGHARPVLTVIGPDGKEINL